VPIDPERIELSQIHQLKQFKQKTYPKALIESYKSPTEFRDKFQRQLELKVRELQKTDASGESPLSISFVCATTGELLSDKYDLAVDLPVVADLGAVAEADRDQVQKLVQTHVTAANTFPIALAVANASTAGIRNLFVALTITSSSPQVSLSSTAPSDHAQLDLWLKSGIFGKSSAAEKAEAALAKFDAEKLQQDGEQTWQLSFEWEALQPQRTRLVKPLLWVQARETTRLSIAARVYADTFPEPYDFNVVADVRVKHRSMALNDLLPTWRELLENGRPKPNPTYIDYAKARSTRPDDSVAAGG
jgi:hypothetical protein